MRSGGGALSVFGALMAVCVVTCSSSSSSASIRSESRDDVVLIPRIHVVVYNRLASGAFNIHCKSRDDDLGFHDIWPGQKYTFSFRINFWDTTLFFCTVKSEFGRAVFDVYSAKRDYRRCSKLCVWDVCPDAIDGYKDVGPIHVHDITIQWNKSASTIL